MNASVPIDALGENDVLLCPNLRSARVWTRAFTHAPAHRGRVQAAPTIMASAQWCATLWSAIRAAALRNAEALPQLLNANQERALWQQVIAASELPAGVSDSALVGQLMEAWGLAHAWQCPEALLRDDSSVEVKSYYRWQTAFREALRVRGWVTAAQLPALLVPWVERLRGVPAPLRCARIVSLPTVQDNPALTTLLRAFEAVGVGHAPFRFGVESCPPEARVFTNAVEEWQAAALWARDIVQASPTAHVVIVVPQLHQVRHAVRRVMRDVLVPEHWGDPFTESGERFNLSLGVRLIDVPQVASALAWLRWTQAAMSLDEVRVALSGVFLRAARSEAARPLPWLVQMIDEGVAELTLSQVSRHLGADHPVHAFGSLVRAWPKRALPSAWAQHFTESLSILGFAQGLIDSESAQAAVALQTLIAGLSDLDALLGACPQAVAWAALHEWCVTHDFQGEGKNAPVQVLGLYESLGFECDALWLTGFSEDVVPEVSEISPLLPRAWQRIAGVGRATPELASRAARRMWAQWQVSARQWVVSVSGQQEHAPVRFSPVLVPTAQMHGTSIATQQSGNDMRAPPKVPLVYLDDHLGLRFEANELPSATSLLQKQAQCAFQAYAQYRLAAQPFPRSQLGVRALTQGSVIHDALRELWNAVQSSQRWNDASDDARQVWIVGAVARSFGPLARECAQRGMPEVATQALKTHCETLLTRWMYDVEAQRAPFTVAQTEAGAALTLSDKQLRLRLDRIDHLADGSALVIDYKTGSVSGLKALEAGDRAALYPQLPAYALAVQARGEESVNGVAYARLVGDEMKLTGIAAVESSDETSNTWFQAPKTTGQARRSGSAWQALLTQWEAALTRSVRAFCTGEASVLPVDDQTCRNCQRHALCRVGSVDNDHEGGVDE